MSYALPRHVIRVCQLCGLVTSRYFGADSYVGPYGRAIIGAAPQRRDGGIEDGSGTVGTHRGGGRLDIGPEDVAPHLQALLLAHLRLVSRVLPGMRDRHWGRILAVGASGIVNPIPGIAISNIGRAALAGYLKTLAAEVAADGVTVNLLLPGWVATARTESFYAETARREGTTAQAVEARDVAAIPMGRAGTAEEFGAMAAFLCSAPASYVTGTATRCDGGLIPSL